MNLPAESETMNLPNEDELAALVQFDTPTICNALELVMPETRKGGYTVRPLVCGFPDMAPVVGYARTATIRAAQPLPGTLADMRKLRDAYYRFVDAGPKPALIVIEDLDGAHAGFGAFWGEVQSAIHRGMGAVGLVTNGSIRDLPQWAPGFQVLAGSVGPAHAFSHIEAFDLPVTVAGMPVRTGDLVHADRHGAVVIPLAAVRELPAAARKVAAREAKILAVARAPGCTAEKLVATFEAVDGIH
jgi:regulator of RNase E activity RraA